MRVETAAALVCFLATSLRAETWTAVLLQPPGADGVATITAISGDRQVGYVDVGEFERHAAAWSGSAGSFVDLNPAGSTFSAILAIEGNRQIGYARFGTTFHGGIWSGRPDSFIDLGPGYANSSNGTWQAGSVNSRAVVWNGSAASRWELNPEGAFYSMITFASGNRFGGQATFNGSDYHPGLWILDPGSPGGFSFSDLYPTSSASSKAVLHAIDDDEQVLALVDAFGKERAVLWRDTAASLVDLHPVHAQSSRAESVAGSQQAGFAIIGEEAHAALWSGFAGSFADLHPPGWLNSRLYATSGARQVGAALLDRWSSSRAAIWSGSAESFVDLHSFLPPGFSSSVAKFIWEGEGRILVAGYAVRSSTGRSEPVLWKPGGDSPPPPSVDQPSPTQRPSLSVARKRVVTTKSRFVVKGRASVDTASVAYRVGSKGRWLKAQGRANWKFTAKLKSGKNLFTIVARNSMGSSTPLKLSIIRRP